MDRIDSAQGGGVWFTSAPGTGFKIYSARCGGTLRLYKEAAILTKGALLLWMLNCVDRCYNLMHYVIGF